MVLDSEGFAGSALSDGSYLDLLGLDVLWYGYGMDCICHIGLDMTYI